MKKPIFTTTNGKQIYEGDKYFFQDVNGDWMESIASRKWILPCGDTYSEITPVQEEGESCILSGNKKIDEYIRELEKANIIWQDQLKELNLKLIKRHEDYTNLSEHCDGVEMENMNRARKISHLHRELNIYKWYAAIISGLAILSILWNNI